MQYDSHRDKNKLSNSSNYSDSKNIFFWMHKHLKLTADWFASVLLLPEFRRIIANICEQLFLDEFASSTYASIETTLFLLNLYLIGNMRTSPAMHQILWNKMNSKETYARMDFLYLEKRISDLWWQLVRRSSVSTLHCQQIQNNL